MPWKGNGDTSNGTNVLRVAGSGDCASAAAGSIHTAARAGRSLMEADDSRIDMRNGYRNSAATVLSQWSRCFACNSGVITFGVNPPRSGMSSGMVGGTSGRAGR
jgi:hypothetical protein